ncbi:MAG: DUF4091 domain-containing protein, partial [Candidatus Glassbacteria bacterium]|nr:DUF4091 domain-containing protein [Candidatus Glassbacteria bacterium]
MITGINTINLRDRVVVLNELVLKKTLIAAFDLSGPVAMSDNLKIKMSLVSEQGDTVGVGRNYFIEGTGGNVGCDVPFDLPQGNYAVVLEILDSLDNPLDSYSRSYDRRALKSSYDGGSFASARSLTEVPHTERNPVPEANAAEQERGYVLFSRHYLRWVYGNSRPAEDERINGLEVSLARNEYEPLTFSLYAMRDLSRVTVSVRGDLEAGPGVYLSRENVAVNVVESIPLALDSRDNYRYMPTLIRELDHTGVPAGECRRFWLTVRADAGQPPGDYRGRVQIESDGAAQELELNVQVRPFTLPDSIDVDYSMCETYEFYELLEDWSPEDREKITEAGRRVYEDYLRHGFNRIWPHSSFYLRRNPDGTPRLDELFTALEEAKKLGLTRPLLWYCGPLVQTSKPRHPGNVRLYDSVVMKERMRELVSYVKHQVQLNGWPEVAFEPVDEPLDDAGYPLSRGEVVNELLEVIRAGGGLSAETGHLGISEGWLDIPVINDSRSADFLDLKSRYPDLPVWMYNNSTIIQNENPAYARYIWGFFVWRSDLGGMSAWTFQNTMNASGDPYTDLDGHGRDVMVAYPDPQGPVPAVIWEALREGVDDYRYLFLLERMIAGSANRSLADSIAGELSVM